VNVDRRFLERDIFFVQPGHAQNPGPINCSCDAGWDAGEHSGKQGFVDRLARRITVDQLLDQENSQTSGKRSEGASD